MAVIGVEGGGGRPGKEPSLRLALLLERDGMGWEEAMPTQMSHEAWHFLQPEGLAVLGTKVCSSGKASQPVPGQWWAQLTLSLQPIFTDLPGMGKKKETGKKSVEEVVYLGSPKLGTPPRRPQQPKPSACSSVPLSPHPNQLP